MIYGFPESKSWKSQQLYVPQSRTSIYHLVMTNSLPWKITIFKNGKALFLWAISHGSCPLSIHLAGSFSRWFDGQIWHAQAARMAWWSRTTSKQELAFELGKFMKAQPLRTAVFWSFQQLGIGDFRIFLSSKSGISWNFTIKTWDFTVKTTIKHWDFMGFDSTMKKWDFMGFHGISWDFDGTWMGDYTLLESFLSVLSPSLITSPQELGRWSVWKNWTPLVAGRHRNPTNSKTNSVPSKFTVAIVKSKSPSFNALGPFDQWRKGPSCSGTKHLHGPSQLVSG